jgi:hypothetical protein
MQSSPRGEPLLLSVFLGFVLLGLLVVAALLLRWAALHIEPDLPSILTLAVAYGLYAIRRLRPLTYSMTELLIGALVVVFIARPGPEVFQVRARFG